MEAAGQVALRHGLTASWHPQPFDGEAYTGMHLHWSLWQVGLVRLHESPLLLASHTLQ